MSAPSMRSVGASYNLAIVMHRPILWYGFAAPRRATEATRTERDRIAMTYEATPIPVRLRPNSASLRNAR